MGSFCIILCGVLYIDYLSLSHICSNVNRKQKLSKDNGMNNDGLSTSDYKYHLPEELIAQSPAERRDHSRLMCVDRTTGELSHRIFKDIKEFLRAGDVLVINNSRVIPARLLGNKKKTPDSVSDGAKCEVLLLKCVGGDSWECIVHPGKRLKAGAEIEFAGGLTCTVREVKDDGNRIVEFSYDKEKYGNIFAVLDVAGSMPTPPYITKKLEDKSRYQTVYADKNGSAAAPTAGLHFTKELLCEIEQMGVKIAPVMLHVGLGTFRPVKVDNIKEHKMHSEYFEVSKESAEIINSAKKNGGRVISVGTTSTRVLESASTDDGVVHPMCGDTDIFIYPGYKFKMLDGLITNFHLPESTLLMLVSAFSSREIMLSAYEEAVKEKYRFFSFGDAMFII